MIELIIILGLMQSPAENSETINKFCSDVVGVPYASVNFNEEEWERFVYCRESIRGPQ